VGGVVPRLIKDIDLLISPELRDSSEWWAKWAAQVPMVREMASGKRVDIFGNDIKLQRGPFSRVTQTGPEDPAYRLLGALNERGLWLPDPSADKRKVKLFGGEERPMSEAEKDRYQRMTGEGYKAFVESQGADLLKMTPEDAKDVIQKNATWIRKVAATQAVR
jgi:hypothetical protein